MRSHPKYTDEYMNQIKKESKDYIKSLFYCPEQLEKLDLYLAKEIKKEKKLEEQIKVNIRNHVDNISSTLKELRISMAEATAIQSSVAEVESLSKDCQQHFKGLEKLISCCLNGSRTSQTLNLLKEIIDMNPKIETTKQMLIDMQLLNVHKNLRQLENIRDRILSKNLGTSGGKTPKAYEKNLLVKNFEPIFKINVELFEKVLFIFKNIAEFAVNEPTQLVSAIRIIEREEKIDEYWESLKKSSDTSDIYIPADRPKQWASFVVPSVCDFLREKIQKIHSSQSPTDKFFLTNYLELTKKSVVTELSTIQTHAIRCFPPSYQILLRVTQCFHQVIRDEISKVIARLGDSPTEVDLIAVLLFEKEYLGEKMFGNKKMNPLVVQTIKNSEPLINPSVIQKLEFHYQTIICENLTEKVIRIVSIENDRLEKDKEPDIVNNQYSTFLSTFYSDFVGIKITYARKLSKTMFDGVFKYCVGAFEQLVANYLDLLTKYVDSNWSGIKSHKITKSGGIGHLQNLLGLDSITGAAEEKGPAKYKHFVQNCIAFANNCIIIKYSANLLFREVFEDTVITTQMEAIRGGGHFENFREEYSNRINNIKSQADEISGYCLNIICDDYITDLGDSFELLFSQRWKEDAAGWSDGFRNSFRFLGNLLERLDKSYYVDMYKRIDYSLAYMYLNRFLNYPLKFNTADLVKYGEHVYGDGMAMCNFFSEKCGVDLKDSYSHPIVMCAEIFKNPDAECAFFEWVTIATTYSDFTDKHATALLKKRNDISKEKLKTVKDIIENARQTKQVRKTGVFSEIKMHLVLKSLKESVDVEIDAEAKVSQLRLMGAEKLKVDQKNLCLLWKAKIMHDNETLKDLRENSVIYYVLKNQKETPETASSVAPESHRTVSEPKSTDQIPASTQQAYPPPPPDTGFPGINMANLRLLDSLGDTNDIARLLSNPIFMDTMINLNPQYKRLFETYPEIATLFRDPATVKQMLDMIKNPSAMRDALRNQDHVLSQLHNVPGALNQYMTLMNDINRLNDTAMPRLSSVNTASAGSSQTDSATANISGEAMPNPWGASMGTQTQAKPADSQHAKTATDTSPLYRDLIRAIKLTNNPEDTVTTRFIEAIRVAVENLSSRAQYGLAQYVAGLQILREESVDLIVNILNYQIAGIHTSHTMSDQLLQSQQDDGQSDQLPLDTGNEETYMAQLGELSSMGFSNKEENIQALRHTYGDVSAAVDWILRRRGAQ